MTTETDRTKTIANLNDQTRKYMGVFGQAVMAPGIAEMSDLDKNAILDLVGKFDDFTEDNDPYGEHDFGSFGYNGKTIFWKIDYYNPTMDGGSEDPANPQQTKRVLTIMLSHEY